MGKFREKKKGGVNIPTSALPDIIFILLFFFMVTTQIKESDPKVSTEMTRVTQLESVDDTKEIVNIYIGTPKDSQFGTKPKIQIKSKFVTVDQVKDYVIKAYDAMPPQKKSKGNIVVYIKVDKGVDYGLVSDVKQKLRDLNVRNINLAAIKDSERI